MSVKTIFLDRDGVINKEINHLYKIDDFVFIDGVFDACLHYIKLGYNIIIVTNQSGIARGLYSESDYDVLTNWMINKFSEEKISILDIFHCAHTPDAHCDCRKPKPGMFINAKIKYGIDMSKSWMIGDKESDIQAALSSGIKNNILVRSGHDIDEQNSKACFILDSIKESVEIILN
jgi:D-glycero-D-manno-heptose 1,7-bisphosphate phosphatase